MAKKSSVITSFAVEPELEPTVESIPPRVNHKTTKRAEPVEVRMKQLAFRIPEAKHTAWKDFVLHDPQSKTLQAMIETAVDDYIKRRTAQRA
jgi:hypothetical protein